MIKITKPGQKEFHGFCTWCGCEFTYEISDLKLSATGNKLNCPTCGKDYHHPSMVQDPTIPGGIGPLQTLPFKTYNDNDPCEGCAWKDYLHQYGSYIGDTPCTWCAKRQVINAIPDGNALQEVLDLAINTSDKTPCNCGDNAVCSKCSGSSGRGYTIMSSSSCLCQGDVWKNVEEGCTSCTTELDDKQLKAD